MSDGNPQQRDEQRWSALMAAANLGDKNAYRQLLDELAKVIEAYIAVRFGHIQAFEDCVQESLLAIHRARHTYDPARPFRPWMFTIVRHKTIDALRKMKRYTDSEGAAMSEELPTDANSDRLHDVIDGAKLLENLSSDHRDALALTQYAGYTVPEAARHLGISESAMKARLRRGLQAIRKRLEAEDNAA